MLSKQTWLVIGAVSAGLALGTAVLAWPSYREVHTMNARFDSLKDKVESLPDRQARVERLVNEVADIQRRIDGDLRLVPADPDIASLFRKLSLPVDGVNVLDQTFSSGSPVEAVAGSRLPTRAMPVTVNMEASFDSIFALIKSAESMHRLVRVASVELGCERPADGDPDFLAATIELEAIYEDPSTAGEADRR